MKIFLTCNFFENISDQYKYCDLIISRSGASSVAEIATVGRASILIPLKSSFEDHQTENALTLVRVGAAKIVNEKEDFNKNLSLYLKEILSNITQEKWSMMSNNCYEWYQTNVHSKNSFKNFLNNILCS